MIKLLYAFSRPIGYVLSGGAGGSPAEALSSVTYANGSGGAGGSPAKTDATVAYSYDPIGRFASVSAGGSWDVPSIFASLSPRFSPTSNAAGGTELKNTECHGVKKSINMPENMGDNWSTERPDKTPEQRQRERWLHGDYKDAPYLMTWRLYWQFLGPDKDENIKPQPGDSPYTPTEASQ